MKQNPSDKDKIVNRQKSIMSSSMHIERPRQAENQNLADIFKGQLGRTVEEQDDHSHRRPSVANNQNNAKSYAYEPNSMSQSVVVQKPQQQKEESYQEKQERLRKEYMKQQEKQTGSQQNLPQQQPQPKQDLSQNKSYSQNQSLFTQNDPIKQEIKKEEHVNFIKGFFFKDSDYFKNTTPQKQIRDDYNFTNKQSNQKSGQYQSIEDEKSQQSQQRSREKSLLEYEMKANPNKPIIDHEIVITNEQSISQLKKQPNVFIHEIPADKQKKLEVNMEQMQKTQSQLQENIFFKNFIQSSIEKQKKQASLTASQELLVRPIQEYQIKEYIQPQISSQQCGLFSFFGANTNKGLTRDYNEDRYSIHVNVNQPVNKQVQNWPKVAFFAVYDGHGGKACPDFLQQTMLSKILQDVNFPQNPKLALKNAIELAEKEFNNWADQQSQTTGDIDHSGSTGVMTLFVDDICYTANVGDSRAIISKNMGQQVSDLTNDHKPEEINENKRIISAGGHVYQETVICNNETITGPCRVSPGRLSLSRTFGDIEAKFPKYGGNPGCVIVTPDIESFKITGDIDYIMLACDGIYDKLTTQEAGDSVWTAIKVYNQMNKHNEHEFAGYAADAVMKVSFDREAYDNLTVLIIGFEGMKNYINNNTSQVVSDNISQASTNTTYSQSTNVNLTTYQQQQAPLEQQRQAQQPNLQQQQQSPNQIITSQPQQQQYSPQPPQQIQSNTQSTPMFYYQSPPKPTSQQISQNISDLSIMTTSQTQQPQTQQQQQQMNQEQKSPTKQPTFNYVSGPPQYIPNVNQIHQYQQQPKPNTFQGSYFQGQNQQQTQIQGQQQKSNNVTGVVYRLNQQ